jgi:PHD/YefM family antitoxin component YafN of YafNO toxin-antitoxin module
MPAGQETLEHLLAVTGQHSERVRQRALALMNRAHLQLDGPVLKVTAARSDLPQLLGEVRKRRPRVISSENRQSVVMLTVDDFLSLVALTDPQAKVSSLGRLPANRRPTTRMSSRDDVEDTPDERALPTHAHLHPAKAERFSGS